MIKPHQTAKLTIVLVATAFDCGMAPARISANVKKMASALVRRKPPTTAANDLDTTDQR
jgi:hypothetical protein